ncbi:MAG: cation:proton antiporter [Candidatus Aenigmarchaeota archaeon]|nr:cation:proton antiporter [Candidatus Aenigmarchaeota archaeon]
MSEILLSIGLLIILAKLLGIVTQRIGLTSLIGQIIAGVIAGPVLGIVFFDDFIGSFIMIGIIAVLFLAGLEVKFDEIKQSTYKASFIAVMAGLLSFAGGFMVGMYFFGDYVVGVAIGTILVSSSNITLFSILQKTGHFHSYTGKFIVAITIADDVVGIMVLSMFNFIVKNNALDVFDILKIFLLTIGFYLFILTLGSRVLSRTVKWLSLFRDEFVLFTIPIAAAFAVSFVTENLGLSLATGAFMSGMAIANSDLKGIIENKTRVVSEGFLEPLFYASIGTLLVFSGLDFTIIAVIFIASVLAKLLGAGLLSRLFGFSRKEAALIGISLIPRGNENIVIAQIIFALGIISPTLYSSIIFAIIATVVISPVLLSLFCRNMKYT